MISYQIKNRIKEIINNGDNFRCITTPEQHIELQRYLFSIEIYWNAGEKHIIYARDGISENHIQVGYFNRKIAIISYNFVRSPNQNYFDGNCITLDLNEFPNIWDDETTDKILNQLSRS